MSNPAPSRSPPPTTGPQRPRSPRPRPLKLSLPEIALCKFPGCRTQPTLQDASGRLSSRRGWPPGRQGGQGGHGSDKMQKPSNRHFSFSRGEALPPGEHPISIWRGRGPAAHSPRPQKWPLKSLAKDTGKEATPGRANFRAAGRGRGGDSGAAGGTGRESCTYCARSPSSPSRCTARGGGPARPG